jgi:dipeptidyl aminopeptidase/acylaminoacyl peptidase
MHRIKKILRISFIRFTAAVLCLAAVGTATLQAQPGRASRGESGPTLEQFCGRGNLYTPRASAMAFSFDGKYAAYLYRPYAERFQGNDLWILELATGKTIRMTGLQGKTKAAAKGPQFRTVSTFTWSPTANELLFQGDGALYRWKARDPRPARQAVFKGLPWSVKYLPNGRGYTYVQSGRFLKRVFGVQKPRLLPVRLAPEEYLSHYEVSPNGKYLVCLTLKAGQLPRGQRTVHMAVYRNRFVSVQSKARAVADDPVSPTAVTVYLASLAPARAKAPSRVFTYKYTGPGDCLSYPAWSPDSGKIAFALYQQSSSRVYVLQARAVAAATKGKRGPAHAAKVAYKFQHTGGPNTPGMIQPQYLADSRRLVFLTELSGYRHLHLLDPAAGTLEQVTKGRFEVYPLTMSRDRQWYYVAATREHPSCRDVYRVGLAKRTLERLSRARGVYGDEEWNNGERVTNIAVSPAGRTVLANFTCFGTPKELVRLDTATGKQRHLTESTPAALKKISAARPDFFAYKNRHGDAIHGYMFKPDGWNKADKRPLLIYVYGGPLGISKQVMESGYHADSYYFSYYMAKKHGFVTCVIDPRGMSGYSGRFEKANFGQPGKPQVEDLVDGVKYLVNHHGVDSKRVGIHGWSFGGFQTQMCLYTAPDVFAAGIAGAGPTEWENYNSWYSTTVIGLKPGRKASGSYSLLPLAKNLKGRLLLVHGMEDDNVLFQDTVQIYRVLLQAGKETLVDLLLDPTGDHGLNGDVSYLSRFRKYEQFLLRTLGKGESARSLEFAVSKG